MAAGEKARALPELRARVIARLLLLNPAETAAGAQRAINDLPMQAALCERFHVPRADRGVWEAIVQQGLVDQALTRLLDLIGAPDAE